MSDLSGGKITFRLALAALFAVAAGAVYSQAVAPTNSLPNPYAGTPFGKMPEGRDLGLDRRHRHRQGRQEHLGRGALRRLRAAVAGEARRAVRLRRLEPRSRSSSSTRPASW